MLGECSKETAFAMLDRFKELGGNFIDTANVYQNGESEQWLGEWMAARSNRDQMVIATKYAAAPQQFDHGDNVIKSNFSGLGAKSLQTSVKQSLTNLQTDYIDILYIHWWDQKTSIPELMQNLNDLVTRGKVLYLAVSDTPAWIVSKANQYARDHGLRQFVLYQGLWNASTRDFERDILPMCLDEGMGMAPWRTLGGGAYKTDEQRNSGEGRKMFGADDTDTKVSKVLEAIANKRGTIMTSVAMAYVMAKAPYVFPIVGGRSLKHLEGNIEALGLELSAEEIAEIEGAYPFQAGFPQAFLAGGPGAVRSGLLVKGPGDSAGLKRVGHFDWVEEKKVSSLGCCDDGLYANLHGAGHQTGKIVRIVSGSGAVPVC